MAVAVLLFRSRDPLLQVILSSGVMSGGVCRSGAAAAAALLRSVSETAAAAALTWLMSGASAARASAAVMMNDRSNPNPTEMTTSARRRRCCVCVHYQRSNNKQHKLLGSVRGSSDPLTTTVNAAVRHLCSSSASSSSSPLPQLHQEGAEKSNLYDPTAFTHTDEQFIHLSSLIGQQQQQHSFSDASSANHNEAPQDDEVDFQISTEVDRLWCQRITDVAKESLRVEKAESETVTCRVPPAQSVRHPLEDFLAQYRALHPEKDEQQLAEVEGLLEDVLRRAYEDMAPPEISVEEFELFVSFLTENELAKVEEEKRGRMTPDAAASEKCVPPRNDAHRYLKFLFKSYWKRKSEEQARVKRREEHLQRDRKELSTWLTALSTVQVRVGKNAGRDRLGVGARVGLPVVLDMGYDHLMNEHAVKDMARQILVMLSFFSKIPEPFHLYVTQFEESSRVYRFLDKYVNGVEHVGATVTSLSCVQVFPAKQLVYLSPDSPHDLEEYDPEDIFVIGGLVDKIVRKGASFDVARTHKIRTARFPIKLNARIKAEGPLNFIEVAHILNRFSTHGDMHRALLEGVSKRRLLPPEQVLNTLNNQLLKANRLVGDPNFVRRAQQLAQKRLEVFNRMQSLNLQHLRQKTFEPHEVAVFNE